MNTYKIIVKNVVFFFFLTEMPFSPCAPRPWLPGLGCLRYFYVQYRNKTRISYTVYNTCGENYERKYSKIKIHQNELRVLANLNNIEIKTSCYQKLFIQYYAE